MVAQAFKLIKQRSLEKLQRRRSSSKTFTTAEDDTSTTSVVEEPEACLLDHLGGMAAMQSILNDYVHRVAADQSLSRVFGDADFKVLSAHQRFFFAMAFGKLALCDKDTLEAAIYRQYHPLFVNGLNEIHFDRMSKHLLGALKARGFHQDVIDEVGDISIPIRIAFKGLARKEAFKNI